MKEGWERKTLSSIGIAQTGTTPPTKDKSNYGDYIPFVKPAHFNKNGELDCKDSKLSEQGLSKGRLFDAHSVMMVCIGATIGKTGFSRIPTSGNQQINVLTPNDDCDYKFIYYGMISPDFQLEVLTVGTSSQATLPIINKSKWQNLTLPIPPLPEQEAIVAILDKAFAAIDQAKANLEQNIINARELFQSKFNDLFANRDESWLKFSLKELLEKKWITSHLDGNHGGDYPKKEEFVDSGVTYLSANCLKEGKIDFSKAKFLTVERASKLRKGIAIDNDVLFAHNATVGPTALLKTAEAKVILGTSLTYYRCDTEFIESDYLLLYMRSNEFSSQYKDIMRQSTRNQVPITKQRTFFHIIPPLEVQRNLIPLLNQLNAKIEKLISVNQTKLTSLEELKKSILQKAFAGELT